MKSLNQGFETVFVSQPGRLQAQLVLWFQKLSEKPAHKIAHDTTTCVKTPDSNNCSPTKIPGLIQSLPV